MVATLLVTAVLSLRRPATARPAGPLGPGLEMERPALEMLLVIALTSVWGYALSRDIIWPALGHKQSRELDAKYEEQLSALLLRALTP